jgi:SAM-dependent methyltransferase
MKQKRPLRAFPALSTYLATDGAAYEIFLGRWTRLLAGPLLDFADLPQTGDLLDVGCGTGSLACAMAARFPDRHVVGVDIAEPYISYARAHASGPRPIFEVGDAASLPYGGSQFAAAMAQLSLNFVPAPDIALREMLRVTRSGGIVAAAGWDFRGGLTYQRLFWDTAAGIDPGAGAARDRLFSAPLALPDGLLKLFENAQLTQVKRASLTIRMGYAAFDDYWGPLLGGQGPVGSYVTTLAPDLQSRVEEAVRRAYCSGAPDGPRSMTATAWAVRAIVP